MSQELSTEISPEIINSLIINGDMSKLTPTQQTQYYTGVCKSLDLNPLTQPFAVMVLNGKKILYAKKDATQQLSNTRKVNTEIKSREVQDTVYVVSVRATLPEGRFTDEIGAVGIAGLKGLELANAMMKAVTKAKRRAVLALCGLGMPDETELDEEQVAMMRSIDSTKSRVEQLVENQMQEADIIKEELQETINAQGTQEKKEKKSNKSKDTAKNDNIKSIEESDPLKTAWEDENTKNIIVGLIDNELQDDKGGILAVKTAMVDRNGTPTKKWSFLIEDKRYGTFDEALANKIMESVDNRRMVKIEFTERAGSKPGVILNDIVNFKEASLDDTNSN